MLKKPGDQLNAVRADLAGLLGKMDMLTKDRDFYAIAETGAPADDEVLSVIHNARNLQRELAVLQARLANCIDRMERPAIITGREVNGRTSSEVLTNGVKIVIFDEFPPKTSVYDRLTIKAGKLTNYAYAEARDRWYGLIKQALARHKGGRIVPAIVYIKYFVPKICDTGNFISKFIVDAIMYNGAIADDNIANVSAVIQEAVLDKQHPRTEIYVFKNQGQLDSIFLQNNRMTDCAEGVI